MNNLNTSHGWKLTDDVHNQLCGQFNFTTIINKITNYFMQTTKQQKSITKVGNKPYIGISLEIMKVAQVRENIIFTS